MVMLALILSLNLSNCIRVLPLPLLPLCLKATIVLPAPTPESPYAQSKISSV